jgi:hypothetical protein
MDAELREAERDGDVQKQFIQLIRSGRPHEAFALAQESPIRTDCTLNYYYSYRFHRANGTWHRPYLEKTVDALVPAVVKSIRAGYISRAMEMTGKETRGQLIKIPVIVLHGSVVEWRAFPVIVCPVDALKDFLQRVTTARNKIETTQEIGSELDADLQALHGTTVYSVEYDANNDGIT